VPSDLQRELDARPKAKAFFAELNRQNRYAILYRLQDAKKPETHARRLAKFVAMLEADETIHPWPTVRTTWPLPSCASRFTRPPASVRVAMLLVRRTSTDVLPRQFPPSRKGTHVADVRASPVAASSCARARAQGYSGAPRGQPLGPAVTTHAVAASPRSEARDPGSRRWSAPANPGPSVDARSHDVLCRR
jgi:Bacteriocin-protection, YdeI or OmpD-Associated